MTRRFVISFAKTAPLSYRREGFLSLPIAQLTEFKSFLAIAMRPLEIVPLLLEFARHYCCKFRLDFPIKVPA